MRLNRKTLAGLIAAGAVAALPALAMAADAAHGAAAEAHGKPSLIPQWFQGLIPALTTLIVFLLLLAVLGKYAWGPIATGLKAREDKIRKDIKDAEEARARAEATLAEYNTRLATAEQQVRDLMSKAQVDAEKIATNVRMQAQRESEEIKNRATRDIDEARKQAMVEFREYAATVATSAAEQILRRNLNAEDQRDLVNRSLDQLQSVGNA